VKVLGVSETRNMATCAASGITSFVWIVVASAVLMLGGCAPAVYVAVPAFHGRVLDADSHPFGGATIELANIRDGLQVATLTSRPDGTFSRPEDGRFFFYFAGFDFAAVVYSVSAVEGVHRSPTTRLSSDLRVWVIGSRPSKDLGDLRLQ